MGFEIIFIFLLALVLFGPKKLPEMARQIGGFMADFKRASNDFKSQIQSEIDRAGAEISTPITGAAAALQGDGKSSMTQSLLPEVDSVKAEVKSTLSEVDDAKEQLMRTARMAFEAQNFTLRPPEPAAVTAEAATPSAPAAAPAETPAPSSTTTQS